MSYMIRKRVGGTKEEPVYAYYAINVDPLERGLGRYGHLVSETSGAWHFATKAAALNVVGGWELLKESEVVEVARHEPENSLVGKIPSSSGLTSA